MTFFYVKKMQQTCIARATQVWILNEWIYVSLDLCVRVILMPLLLFHSNGI